MLGQQHFTANPLCRLSDIPARFRASSRPDNEVSLVVVAGREVVVRSSQAGPGVHQDLQALLLRQDDPELRLEGDQMALEWVPDDGMQAVSLPLYLLGQDVSGRWTFALDISSAKELFLTFLRESCELEVAMKDVRVLLPGLSLDACAIAGQAVALSQWHQTHGFCPRCGQPTVPFEAGTRRRCTGPGAHKLYPRTDPVVIAVVESPDGQRALLGRSAKSTPGMYTCLSGFIDQCEGIEEAVRREIMEEARIAVSEVHILGTQPWPIGRYGSCELMIGCVAKAQSYEVLLNASEMEDVQWYDRAELAAAVQAYDSPLPLQEIQRRSWQNLGFFVPPPFAIAHHIMRAWALRETPWFSLPSEPQGGMGGVAANGTGSIAEEGERQVGGSGHTRAAL